MTTAPTEDRHRIERVRHELKRRLLTVSRVERVTPKMIRVTLTGEDLDGFVSAGYDDHIKLLLPRPGEEVPFLAPMGADGKPVVDPDNKPVMRDYTPRRFDAKTGELDIDFAVHEAGPATEWAEKARPGDTIGVGGPRGSMIVADDFDWYLLVGDETALPAIGRRLEELPPTTRALVVAEVAGPEEEQQFRSKAAVAVTWLHRGKAPAGTTQNLDQALRALTLPEGDGYVWMACESVVVKRLRAIMVDERGHPSNWIKAPAYWRLGEADFHEPHG